MESSLKKRYSIKLLTNIISAIIGAVLIAIVPKALGPIVYGQFIYLQDFFMKVIGFLDMGSSIAFFTKLSANQKRKELMSFYFLYASVLLVLITLFIGFIFYFDYTSIFFPDIPKEYIFMGLFYGFFLWLTQIFIKISDAYALTVSVELIKIMHKVISLFLLLYFIYFTLFDLEQYFLFHYIALLSFLLILAWLFIKKDIFTNILNFKFSIFNLTKEFIAYCHPLVVYSLLSLVVGFLDIWMLQKFGGSVETGYYGLAYSLAAMCFLFTSAMTPLITREFSKSYEEKDLANMRKLFFRYIPMLYAIATFFSLFVSMQSVNIIAIFTDKKFEDAYLVLVIMAFYPIHQTYGQLSGSIFYATGNTKLLRNISFFTQPFGILLSFILIYSLDLGAMGLAYKMIIGQVIGVNIQLYFNARFLDFKIKHFLFHQLYVVLLFLLLSYMVSSVFIFTSPLLSFLVSGMIYTILVIISAYIFPSIFATNRDEIKYYLMKAQNVIKNKIKK